MVAATFAYYSRSPSISPSVRLTATSCDQAYNFESPLRSMR